MKFYRSPGPVAAITLDLDDTLYDNRRVIVRAEKLLLDWLEKRCPAMAAFDWPQWQAFRRQVVVATPSLQGFVTEIRRAQIRLAGGRCGLSQNDAAKLADDAVDYFLHERSNFTVPDDALDVLEALKKRLPLVAITNGNVDTDMLGLTGYFSVVLKAGPDGAAKPATDLFHKARHHLGIPGKQILHVGDHLKSDVAGARASGFRTVWLNETKMPLRMQRHASVMPDVEIYELRQLLVLAGITGQASRAIRPVFSVSRPPPTNPAPRPD